MYIRRRALTEVIRSFQGPLKLIKPAVSLRMARQTNSCIYSRTRINPKWTLMLFENFAPKRLPEQIDAELRCPLDYLFHGVESTWCGVELKLCGHPGTAPTPWSQTANYALEDVRWDKCATRVVLKHNYNRLEHEGKYLTMFQRKKYSTNSPLDTDTPGFHARTHQQCSAREERFSNTLPGAAAAQPTAQSSPPHCLPSHCGWRAKQVILLNRSVQVSPAKILSLLSRLPLHICSRPTHLNLLRLRNIGFIRESFLCGKQVTKQTHIGQTNP